MNIEDMKAKLKNELTQKRYDHTIGVMNTAEELARKYGADVQKAILAGLLHDCAKNYSIERLFEICRISGIDTDPVMLQQPSLLHGPAGAAVARDKYGIEDEEILGAIRWHTTGKADMSLLEKIIYIADYIEPEREFPGVGELRKLAFEDLDSCMLLALDRTIAFVLERSNLLHANTVIARNYLLMERAERLKDSKS